MACVRLYVLLRLLESVLSWVFISVRLHGLLHCTAFCSRFSSMPLVENTSNKPVDPMCERVHGYAALSHLAFKSSAVHCIVALAGYFWGLGIALVVLRRGYTRQCLRIRRTD
jgi:hypothetical protein